MRRVQEKLPFPLSQSTGEEDAQEARLQLDMLGLLFGMRRYQVNQENQTHSKSNSKNLLQDSEIDSLIRKQNAMCSPEWMNC